MLFPFPYVLSVFAADSIGLTFLIATVGFVLVTVPLATTVRGVGEALTAEARWTNASSEVVNEMHEKHCELWPDEVTMCDQDNLNTTHVILRPGQRDAFDSDRIEGVTMITYYWRKQGTCTVNDNA